ncbi:hypothetical protein KOW79_006993 [Hemibagrus wyckioides]|uniref:Ig-like domain-containing protein n=1 Tax=Hemibagrus wyckioides TaxID=337641 RepID=A0A9D3SR84_9TELE|nr:hypothetical protein KOW79_006993 [Hemibagrus wyckioides]
MAGFSVFILIFCTIYTVELRRNFSGSVTEPGVYQADEVLCVNVGDSATLPCCVFGDNVGVVIWYKQPNGKQPRIMSRRQKSDEVTFFSGFQNLRFQLQSSLNCFNMTISNIIHSDEATYYCAIISPYSVFGSGTYLKIKETSKPALSDNSVEGEPTLHGNNTNMNTQENTESGLIRSLHWTVISLGMALGLCALLIFFLTYFILRKRECDKINASVEESPGMRQESEAETLNYAALKFSKRKAKAEKITKVDECVYSTVK